MVMIKHFPDASKCEKNLVYYKDGSGLSFDDMKAKCESKKRRLCYFDELCPQVT